jgi:iron(III) transport system ATP-binding protein
MLRLIAGLELPTAGAIAIGGRDVSHVPAAERDVSMVFQSYALFPHMSVLENVRYGLVVSKMPRAQADERARATLQGVGLSGYDERLPSELSGGQQQRVAVARALVLEPSVLLFDEPLSNLDARLRRQMREEIRDLQQRLALTVVYVTHDQAEAMAVSDRIIVMNRAAIAQEGAPRELYEQPRDPFVAGFMGDANRVRGMLTHRNGAQGDVMLGTTMLSLPHRGLPDGDVELSIRPESITLRPPGMTALAGTIRKAAYLGGIMEYTLDTGIGELFAVSTVVERPYAVGDGVSVELAHHGVVLIPPGASDECVK